MITENQITEAIEIVSKDQDQTMIDFGMAYPQLSKYLLSDTFLALSIVEKSLMLFAFLVMYSTHENHEDFDFESFLEKEEVNWQFFEDNLHLSWEKKMDVAFKDYPEEDLLAFIDDLLVDDEDDEVEVTKIGKEVIFATAKSYIDSLN